MWTTMCWQASWTLPCYPHASPLSFWHLHWKEGQVRRHLPPPPPLPRNGQAQSARRGGRTTPTCRSKPHSRSVTLGVAPALRGCSGPCTALVLLFPWMEKWSQKCKFTKKSFHRLCLLFHSLFMFLISSCWLNYATLSTFAEHLQLLF